MDRSIIFYFSGTGNSLKVAKEIGAAFDNCEITSMGKPYKSEVNYDNIGFIFPTYGMGLPRAVEGFLEKTVFSADKKPYIFSIATCGGRSGNALSSVEKLLKSKGLTLSYGNEIPMFANYVALYGMANNAQEKASQSNIKIKEIVDEIKNKKIHQGFKSNAILSLVHNLMINSMASKDKGFNVSNECIGCEKCAKVCPVSNITMQGGKPSFSHHCEQCMACVQWCPKQAINYKDKTQSRGRYHHPEISYADMTQKKD